MQKSASFRRYLYLFALCLHLITQVTSANAFATVIKHAELVLQDDYYVLNADIHYQLSPIAHQALHNGIPLTFKVLLKINKGQGRLWQNTIKELTIHYQLTYLTLLNVYRIENQEGNEIGRFSALSNALNTLGLIRNIYVAKQTEWQQATTYQAALKVHFDKEALPLPLRPAAYFRSAWHLSSEWLQWSLPIP